MREYRISLIVSLAVLGIPLGSLLVRLAYAADLTPALRSLGGSAFLTAAFLLLQRRSGPWVPWARVALFALIIHWMDQNAVANLDGPYYILPFAGVLYDDKRLSLFGAAVAIVGVWIGNMIFPDVASTFNVDAPIATLLTNVTHTAALLFVAGMAINFTNILRIWQARLATERERNIKQMTQQMARQWAVSVEAKHAYTAGHSDRVTSYAVALAAQVRNLNMDLETFELGCLLHDVGKIAIPDQILDKPGRLTPGELEIIQRHSERGYEMVVQTGSSPAVAGMVLHHHERWDGKGYPDRLSGESIPMAARVLAVADTFDAMTSLRPYRRPLTPAEAFTEIAAQTGAQFDPAVVAVLGGVRHEWEEIYRQNRRVADAAQN